VTRNQKPMMPCKTLIVNIYWSIIVSAYP
jgi:hypothetical protein